MDIAKELAKLSHEEQIKLVQKYHEGVSVYDVQNGRMYEDGYNVTYTTDFFDNGTRSMFLAVCASLTSQVMVDALVDGRFSANHHYWVFDKFDIVSSDTLAEALARYVQLSFPTNARFLEELSEKARTR